MYPFPVIKKIEINILEQLLNMYVLKKNTFPKRTIVNFFLCVVLTLSKLNIILNASKSFVYV